MMQYKNGMGTWIFKRPLTKEETELVDTGWSPLIVCPNIILRCYLIPIIDWDNLEVEVEFRPARSIKEKNVK